MFRIKSVKKTPLFREKSAKNAIFALNLYKFTPAKKNLYGYTRGSRDKLEVWEG